MSSSSSEETSQSPSFVRSPQVQRRFSINLKQTKNPLFQDVPKTNRVHTPLENTTKFFSKESFQSQHTEIEQVPAMAGHKPKHSNHSRHQDQPRNDRGKYHDTDEE